MAPGWWRSIRPPDIPNENDPASVPPATVGPPAAVPGDAHGVTFADEGPPGVPPPRISTPAAWSGWPGEWQTSWFGPYGALTDTAWICVDLNATLLSTMPPYLVKAAPTLDATWLTNPDPDLYSSWCDFAKQLFWDYMLGEAFVLATAWYTTGWPARFHVVPPWYVNVKLEGGRRYYSIGDMDVTAQILHLRYQSTIIDLRGHGPLEATIYSVQAAALLARYASGIASAGGVPSSVLEHPEQLTAAQAAQLRDQWIQARLDQLGAPAVLSGGLTWKPTQLNPNDMALIDLLNHHARQIAVAFQVPPYLVGLPLQDTMTYKNVISLLDYHWRAGLRPKAEAVMSALSNFLLPRGTVVELNRDAYVEAEPLQRAQTAQILNSIVDAQGNPALTVPEIRGAERLDSASPAGSLFG